MEKKMVLRYFVLAIIFGGLIGGLLILKNVNFTGYAVLGESGESFDNGSYVNTIYNGSAVVLVGRNLTGNYTSQVFDVGNRANWNNLTYKGEAPSVEYLYGVDGAGDVYKSNDLGVNWGIIKENYGRTTDTVWMFSDSSAIYILTGSNKEVWKSVDDGVSWSVVNDSFTINGLKVGESDSNNLYVIDGPGTVWKSADSGVTWSNVGDFNGVATNDAKGVAINSSGTIFVVDGAGDVYLSLDSGVTWIQQIDGYGGSTGTDGIIVDSSNNLNILLNSDIYRSTDQGITWSKINDDFSPYLNDGLVIGILDDDLYIYDGVGRTFKSADSGLTWSELGDMNGGASNDPKGLATLTRISNLSFQVRNCSASDCSDASFTSIDLTDLSLTSRYFQYKVDFTSSDSSVAPGLYNVTIDYTILNTAPSITLVSPQEGATYGYNESLALNFSVSDVDGNLDSCWYNINGGTNTVINNCQNTTFDISGDGSYVLNIYVNDTQGEEASDNASFSVQVMAPTIVLHFPIDKYLSYQNMQFNYTPTDIDLDSCELWGDFAGSFSLNQTDSSPNNGAVNTLTLSLPDGTYSWNIKCNDSVGNSAMGGNKAFYIDTVTPSISLTEPAGTKSSRTVTTEWYVSDSSSISCLYNVYQGASLEITNTSINCSANSASFEVSADADFTFNFYTNDSAGNDNSASLGFSVDTSAPNPPSSPPSGGGGGGGGSRYTAPSASNKLQVSQISNLIVGPGDRKKMALSVNNIGKSFLNECKIKGKGDYSEWISAEEIKGLSAGEEHEFIFTLNIPDKLKAGSYKIEMILACHESNESTSFNAEIIERKLAINLIDVERDTRDKLRVIYSLTELSGVDHEVKVEIILFGYDNERLAEITETQSIGANSNKDFESTLDIQESLEGSFNLLISAISKTSSTFIQEEIVLGSSRIGGLAIFSITRDTTISIALIALFSIFAFFILRRIWKLRKMRKDLKLKKVKSKKVKSK